MSDINMFSAFLRLKEFDLEFSIDISLIDNICSQQIYDVPFKLPVQERFLLWFVYRFPLRKTYPLHDQKIIQTGLTVELCSRLHNKFNLLSPFTFFSSNPNEATFPQSPFFVNQGTLQCLVPHRHYLMKGELQTPNEIMMLIVIQIGKVVHVIDQHFIHLTHLKIVLNIKLLHPLRWQTVHDHFSASDSLPLSTLLVVKHCHSIRSSKCIIIR
jgi:hypothetical protein